MLACAVLLVPGQLLTLLALIERVIPIRCLDAVLRPDGGGPIRHSIDVQAVPH